MRKLSGHKQGQAGGSTPASSAITGSSDRYRPSSSLAIALHPGLLAKLRLQCRQQVLHCYLAAALRGQLCKRSLQAGQSRAGLQVSGSPPSPSTSSQHWSQACLMQLPIGCLCPPAHIGIVLLGCRKRERKVVALVAKACAGAPLLPLRLPQLLVGLWRVAGWRGRGTGCV